MVSELKRKIDKQERKDLKKCIDFLQTKFSKIKYIIPENLRSDVNVTGTTKSNKEYYYNIEIKERYCYSYTYTDTILEVDKYNYLIQDTTKIPIYFIIFKDCIAVFNLAKIDINKVEKRKQLMNKTTFNSDEKIEKIEKNVYGLTTDLATTFNINNYNKIKNAVYQ